jgi:alkaline phosphatase D
VLTTVLAAVSILGQEAPVARIALGSCQSEDARLSVYPAILGYRPQVFVFLGDNVYADVPAQDTRAAAYAKMAARPEFQALVANCRVFATWDDHDYGLNDAGAEYDQKEQAQQEFNDFWKVPADSPRRQRPGIYDSVTVGPEGRRVQFVLLDTRFFRSALKPKPAEDKSPGRYVPDDDPAKTMLGEAQWAWLKAVLQEPAELRIVCSSVQVVAEDHGWEKWANFPRERQRLFDLVRETGANGVLFVSGDRHLAEISMTDGGVGYPMYDLTASALTQSQKDWRKQEANRWRVATVNYGDNFGCIEADWSLADPEVRLQVRDVAGDVVVQQKLRLSWLKPGRIRS